MRRAMLALALAVGCGGDAPPDDGVGDGTDGADATDATDGSADGADGAAGADGVDGTDETGDPTDTGGTEDTGDPGPTVDFNACGVDFRDGHRAAGTPEDPILTPSWPMVDVGTTVGAPTDAYDTYDCAPDTLETGPEVLYRFTVDRPGSFRAELDERSGDVDLHLLRDPSVDADGHVSGCLARGHQRVEVETLEAGAYWLVLDSWSDGASEYPGAYEVAFEWWEAESWREVEVDEDLVWRTLRTDQDGGQTFQVLEVGLEGARRFAPAIHGDCQTVAERATELGAIAGMNGGFFGMSDCASLDFVKAGGTVLSVNRLNGLPQRAVGWSSDGGIQHTWVEETDTWPEVSEGISGYPSLVTRGTAAAEARPGEQVYSSIDWSQHPRSALGITADDRLLLVTVAGRTTAGAGLTTPRLAEWMVDLGAVDAVALDGGGSTTLFLDGCWAGGVINHPSDNARPDWRGARTVADGVYLY